MIGAGSISTQAQPAQNLAFRVVQRKSAAEDDDSANWLADHRIVLLAKLIGTARVHRLRIRRSAGCKAIETLSGLSSGVEVGRGQREVGGAERIGRVGLLGGD